MRTVGSSRRHYPQVVLVVSSLSVLILTQLCFLVFVTNGTDRLPYPSPPSNCPPPARPDAKIAYVVVLSGCGGGTSASAPHFLADAAAVLAWSIQRLHRSPREATVAVSRYPAPDLHALVHDEAAAPGGSCSSLLPILRSLNYTVTSLPSVVRPSMIGGDGHVRDRIGRDGCCGELELLKLHVYNMDEYDAVVYLDLDAVVLRPLDDLFDTIIAPSSSGCVVKARFGRPLPPRVDAFFTRDYRLVPIGRPAPIQGGFLVVRPSPPAYDEMVQAILRGNYSSAGDYGWEGTGHGLGYGGLTVQGILPWFYDERRELPPSRPPHRGVELSECRYNAQFAQPRHDKTTKGAPADEGKCTTGLPEDQCEDCRRNVTLSRGDVVTAHLTGCGKPWRCLRVKDRSMYAPLRAGPGWTHQRLCTELHGAWFGLRREAGEVLAGRGLVEADANLTGGFLTDVFGGYCRSTGFDGYVPLKFV